MIRQKIVVLLLCIVSVQSFGQSNKYSNEFLSIGVGARSLGMANSTVANVNDVTSGYWNPAGLTSLGSNFDAGLMHAEYFAGIAKYDYAGAAMELDTNSWIGATFIRFGVDDIPNTTDLIDKDGNIDYDRISKFSAADYAFLISYARKSKIPELSYGASVKIIYRNIGKFANAWGFGLDAGLQYQKNDWRFGVLARDITSTFNAWSFNEDELIVEVQDSIFNFAPENALEITLPKVILGVSRTFKVYQDFNAMIELDADFTFDGQRHVLVEGDPVSIDPHLGIELDYQKLVFIRFGVGNFQRVEDFSQSKTLTLQPNFGIGIQIKGFSVDYALTDIGDQSIALYSNVFSLRYTFSRKSK